MRPALCVHRPAPGLVKQLLFFWTRAAQLCGRFLSPFPSTTSLLSLSAAVCCAIVCERHPMQTSTGHPSRRLRVPLYLYNTYSGSGSRHKTAKLWSCRQQQRRGECKEVLGKRRSSRRASGSRLLGASSCPPADLWAYHACTQAVLQQQRVAQQRASKKVLQLL